MFMQSKIRFYILLTMVFCLPAYAQFKPERAPKYNHFMFGVYVSSIGVVQTVPMEKMFTDFLTHGIEIISINTYNYYPLAQDRKLNQYAKANDVQILLQMYNPEPIDVNDYTDEYLLKFITAQIESLNKLPDSDAVVGWMLSDEIEDPYLSGDNRDQRRATAERNLRRMSQLVRQIDPIRRVAVNHDHLPWMSVYEDEVFCSTGYTTRFNAYKVRDRIAEARKQGYENYFLVSQASLCPPGIPNLRWYGYQEPINDAVLETLTVGQAIQDQAEVAFHQGSAGVIYFLYWAGSANYLPYTLTDINGDDYQGKWDGVFKAACNIRTWEGLPSCRITSPVNKSWVSIGKLDKDAWWITDVLKVKVTAQGTENDPVKIVKADYSIDGCLTWRPLPDINEPPYEFSIKFVDVPKDKNGVVCWLRARAINGKGASLWNLAKVKVQVQD